MKHSEPYSGPRTIATALLWTLPLLLIVPNVWLDFTEPYTAAARAVNVLLPAGVYFLLLSALRRNSITALCLLPVMILCAFQIVLLFLYGQSIIAIDMFLNVMTTNVHEATELLRNLSAAIAAVCLLYLPPLGLAIAGTVRKSLLDRRSRRAGLLTGTVLTAAGAGALAVCLLQPGGYAPGRSLFPVNVVSNILSAAVRTGESNAYARTSADFRFGAIDSRPGEAPEVYVLVIGETSRADNWQLAGYDRPTNPRLSRRPGLVFYKRTLSESNTTHKSVPLMMSPLTAGSFGDSIYRSRGIIDAFNEAGYRTLWISNQQRNGSLIDFFGERADSHIFLKDDDREHFDMEIVPYLRAALVSPGVGKLFAVLHTYGSHFNYKERYPAAFSRFTPEPSVEASAANRPGLINAYDNTILYTDAVLDSIIATLESTGIPAALFYTSDHGEDIFDDSRNRFLHASPTPTYWQLHVPAILWMSGSYRRLYPGEYTAALRARDLDVSSSRSAFHTLAHMAGLRMPCLDTSASLVSAAYTPRPRLYVNDYNEGIPLREAGLALSDLDCLRSRRISAE